ISNPKASQRNLAFISHLLSLKFSNLSMRLSEFSWRSRESSSRVEVEEDDRSQ
ncbi:hypothetical protein Tco_0351000, partial [Tanacetum coccineum]